MTSAANVELASDGLIWRDAAGRPFDAIKAVADGGAVLITLRGNPPRAWSPEATRHLSRILAEVARNAEMAARLDADEKLVPRRAPSPVDAAAPWG